MTNQQALTIVIELAWLTIDDESDDDENQAEAIEAIELIESCRFLLPDAG